MHSDISDIGVYILDKRYAKEYCAYFNPTILRYNIETPVDFYNASTILSYGTSKGTTFDRIIVIPVGTVMPFILNGQTIASKRTRAKFYVACTRARYSTVFCVDNAHGNALFIPSTISIGGKEIPCFKYNKC